MRSRCTAYIIISVALTAPGINLFAQGMIVPNGVIYEGFNGIGYEIDVVHNPSQGFATGFFLDPNGSTPPGSPQPNTFQFNPVVDVGVRVFQVSPGDTISMQPVLAGNFPELTFPNSYVFEDSQPVYVGLYTGNQSFAPPNGIYSDPLFGWAELENVNGAIELLDSALEYQGGGIIAGTDTIVPAPEPSTWALLMCGGALLGMVTTYKYSKIVNRPPFYRKQPPYGYVSR